MRAIILGFGLLILCLLLFFQVAEWQVWRGKVGIEVALAVASIVFFAIGVLINRRSEQRRAQEPLTPGEGAKLFVEAPAPPEAPSPDPEAVRASGLTARELEVLQKLAEGLSNAEIAAALFLSETTIKTHVSNILFKLDVKRRTAAVQAARARGILK